MRPAPDRPGDRDQQQAAEVCDDVCESWGCDGHPRARTTGELVATARAEEAARWQAKIEAVADEFRRAARATADPISKSLLGSAANGVRALLDGER